MTVDSGGDRFHVSRRANGAGAPPDARRSSTTTVVADANPVIEPQAPPVPPSPPPVTAPPVTLNGRRVPIAAPSVGLFWRAPAPGAPPFVDVGSRVDPDDTIAIIEVMKLMSPLKAGVSGVVTAILAENGAAVARGDAVVLVDTGA
jgi:acetyl-CoA carboxylase biotin carboxyl carrier protein